MANPFGIQSAKEDSPFRFAIPGNTFSDPDGDLLTITASSESGSPLPAWLRFDPSTQTLSGTPDWRDAGTVVLRITAADARQASVSTPLQINVSATSVPPTDIRAKIKVLGMWGPLDAHAPKDGQRRSPVLNAYAVLPLGQARRDGVAMTAWSYSGFDWEGGPQSADTTPVDILLLDQTADGHLQISTADYVSSARTNGGQSVIATDVNGDRIEDIVFLAHNESPFIAKPSTIFLSEGPRRFRSMTLADAVMAHDAQLVQVDGRPAIATMSFLTSPAFPQQPKGLLNPLYSWDPLANLNARELSVPGGGMSINAGDFRGNGRTSVVIGDSTDSGLSDPRFPERYHFTIGLFDYADGRLEKTGIHLVPYFSAREAYSSKSSLWGRWTTHIPRIWADDFNHDGHLDLLASTSMWPEGLSMLQLLQNQGAGLGFTDRTDDLNPDYDPRGGEVDYSMQRRDIDSSGIDTYFLSNAIDYRANPFTAKSAVLVNDGTGRLYEAIKEVWSSWDEQVRQQLRSKYGTNFDEPCRFIAYADGDGLWNFLAYTTIQPADGSLNGRCVLASISTGLDVVKSIKANLTVRSRNHSSLIRTFAGDDTIHAQDSDPDATVDGGAGTDTVVYPSNRADYTVVKEGDSYSVTKKTAPSRRDILKRVEKVAFRDETLSLP